MAVSQPESLVKQYRSAANAAEDGMYWSLGHRAVGAEVTVPNRELSAEVAQHAAQVAMPNSVELKAGE